MWHKFSLLMSTLFSNLYFSFEGPMHAETWQRLRLVQACLICLVIIGKSQSGPLTIGCEVQYQCRWVWEFFGPMSNNNADGIPDLKTKVWYFLLWTKCLCQGLYKPNNDVRVVYGRKKKLKGNQQKQQKTSHTFIPRDFKKILSWKFVPWAISVGPFTAKLS